MVSGMSAPTESQQYPTTAFAPELLAAEAHDLGYLILEAQRELSKSGERERLLRLLATARDHCNAIIEGAQILRANFLRPDQRSEVDLLKLASAELELWQPRATASSVRIGLKNSGKASIMGDTRLVARAIRNLLLNAIAAAIPNSEVDINIEAEKDSRVAVSVSNSGRPPTDEIIERLSNQAAMNASHPTEISSGLGLFIAHRVALLHDGHLSVRHENGVTTFTITFKG